MYELSKYWTLRTVLELGKHWTLRTGLYLGGGGEGIAPQHTTVPLVF